VDLYAGCGGMHAFNELVSIPRPSKRETVPALTFAANNTNVVFLYNGEGMDS
jgi:hypothetical protein